MRINIYTSFNGVGLERDYNILKSIFESQGHIVDYADNLMDKTRAVDRHIPERGNIAFHLEIPRYELLTLCDKNIMIPNPEWFGNVWLGRLNNFQEVWAKTHDTERIFSRYHKNVIFTSFTSLDKFKPEISKEKMFIHTAGKSTFKGTEELLKAYDTYDLPKCFMTTQKGYQGRGNIIATGYLSEEKFDVLLNACLLHIMPSYYEGFGHAIWEAMACGCCVITTDAAPMNEFVQDKRFLVQSKVQGHWELGPLNKVIVADLMRVIKSVNEMSEHILIEEGKLNRQRFLDNDKFFREKVISLL
jgi:glycosyltransferase involved in cell wall biosynthesis